MILLWRIAFTLPILIAVGLFANQNDQKDKPFSLRVPVDLVVVPVTVEDSDGNLVFGLQKEDFELYEEGVLQTITYFSQDPVPISAAILIDRSTDEATQSNLRQTLVPLVESFSPFDEVAIFQFENTTDKIQGFTSNKDEILKAFGKISLTSASAGFAGGPVGGAGGELGGQTSISGIPLETATRKVQPPKTLNTHIHDAIFTAAQELRVRDRSRRGVIVIISNGQNAPGNRHSYDATMEAVNQREIGIYAIAQGSSLLYRKLNILSKYATPTGGAVFYPVKSGSFVESYQRIAQMARNKYVLGYLPANEAETITFRKISVKLKNTTVKAEKIRTRSGYYAVPTAFRPRSPIRDKSEPKVSP